MEMLKDLRVQLPDLQSGPLWALYLDRNMMLFVNRRWRNLPKHPRFWGPCKFCEFLSLEGCNSVVYLQIGTDKQQSIMLLLGLLRQEKKKHQSC